MSLTALLKPVSQNYKNGAYYAPLKDFYTKHGVSSNGLDQMVGEMAKVLSGDYIEGGKRVWLWEDRLDKFYEMYNKAKRSRHCRGELGKIRHIIRGNRYANQRYQKEMARLYKDLKPKRTISSFLYSCLRRARCLIKKT